MTTIEPCRQSFVGAPVVTDLSTLEVDVAILGARICHSAAR